MKLLILLLISSSVFAQDSTKIQVALQARDCEYISSISSMETSEDFFDAVKSKFRVQTPPTGSTNVTVDSMYIHDWLPIIRRLKTDYVAIENSCTNRVETVLRAVNNAYLTAQLDLMVLAKDDTFSTMRNVGRFKLKKKN